jgi:hypothetical protein
MEAVAAAIGIALAVVGIGAAVVQIMDAKRVSKIAARLSVLQVCLAAELAGRRSTAALQDLGTQIEAACTELAGKDPSFDSTLKLVRELLTKEGTS